MAVLLSFNRTSLKVGPQLTSKNLDFKRVSTIYWYQWLTLLKLIMKMIWFILNTCFPCGRLKFWHMLFDQHPTKTMKTDFLMSFPDRHFIYIATAHCWGRQHILYQCTGRGLLEAYLQFPPDFLIHFYLAHLACTLLQK